jgi:hypothetical protein
MAERTIIEGLPGIAIQILEPIPEGQTPFGYDKYHMGKSIGTNAMMMYANYDDARCHYVILINTETGSRVRIEFNDGSPENEDSGKEMAGVGNLIDMLIKNPHLYGG